MPRAVPCPSRYRGGVSRCGLGGVPRRRKTRLRRETGAEAGVSYGIPSGVGLPASFWRRKAGSCSGCVRDRRCGVIFSPEGGLWQQVRTEPSLRRRFLAGRRICAAVAYGTLPSASFSRRRAHLRSGGVRNLPSGVVFSPEGGLSQQVRTRPPLRRHFLAGSTIVTAKRSPCARIVIDPP